MYAGDIPNYVRCNASFFYSGLNVVAYMFLLTLEDEMRVFAEGNVFIFYNVIYCNSNVLKL